MHAVVLAGGQGTRLRPLTDSRPKPLLPFCGEPFAAGLLRRLADAGVQRVTFLIAQEPAPFEALHPLGGELGIAVATATEEAPLDTAGAARRLLRNSVDDPVLVCNGDILTDLDLRQLLLVHQSGQAAATIALTRVEDTTAFGVVVCDERGHVRRFVEKPPPGMVEADTVNAGTYVLGPDVFDGFPGDGRLSFERDVFPGLLTRGATVLGCVAPAFWADLGTPERYLDGTAAVLGGHCDWPLPPGMRAIEHGVLVHDTADVGGAVLLPGTVVGAGSAVARGATLAGTVLFDQVTVGPNARLDGCIVGEGASVAAGVALRGAVLADRAVAG